jgi:hypothetical protein
MRFGNKWQASVGRSKRHGLDGKLQHLGLYEDERDAALAVDSFARVHMPGAAVNFPTLDELYVSKLKVRLTHHDRGDGQGTYMYYLQSHSCSG